jgi:integrase/recombinase XerD
VSRSPLPALLRRLARQWLRWRAAESVSRSTQETDEHALRRFLDWLETDKPQLRSLVEVDRQVLEEYAVALTVYETEEGARLKVSSRQRYLVSLVSFFRWLEAQGKVLANPAEDLPLPKLPKKLPRGVLSTKEVARVLAVPDLGTPAGLRDRAILELLYSTGIRNAELRALELGDLNLAEGLLTVREGKGAKDRVVPIGRVAQRFLERYLEEGRPELNRSRFERHVLLSRFGRPLSKTHLMRRVEEVGRRAGLGKPLTCHGLRHTCATHLLRGRADIRHIQVLLGHKTLSATEVYTHVAVADLKKVHERCHPRERAK